MIGLRRALLRLAVRSLMALVLWAAVVWLITPLLNFLVPHWAIFGVTALLLFLPGVAIGHGLSRNLPEIAGMTGLPVAGMAMAFGWAVAVLGVMLADAIRPVDDWQYGFTMLATGFWITIWVIRATLLES